MWTLAATNASAAPIEASAVAAIPGAQAYQDSYDLEAGGKLEEALVALRGVPTGEQGTYVFALRKAWLNHTTGRYDAAIKGYQEAMGLAPSAVEPKLGIMLPQMALRRWLDVEKSAQAVLGVDAKSYLGTSRLAFALYNLGRYAEAEKQYRAILVAYPSDVEMRAGLAWSLLQRGERSAAAKEFSNVLGVAPRHASAAAGARAAQ